MRFIKNDPPRVFEAGFDTKVQISDFGKIELKPDEQITFITESGNEYDIMRKSFGFYATPSLNGRLQNSSLRAVLAKNRIGKFFLLLVEKGKEDKFFKYIDEEKIEIVCWMDTSEVLENLEKRMKQKE